MTYHQVCAGIQEVMDLTFVWVDEVSMEGSVEDAWMPTSTLLFYKLL